jgi:hypothetical protein
MMEEHIARTRQGESGFPDFGFSKPGTLATLREYRGLYPNGKLHIYGFAAVAATAIASVAFIFSLGLSLSEFPPNQIVVRITSPADGAIFTAPADIIIRADAGDLSSNPSRVDFYQRDNLIGSSTSAPFSVTWSKVPTGSYSLTAKAFYGRTVGKSDAVRITVNAPENTEP